MNTASFVNICSGTRVAWWDSQHFVTSLIIGTAVFCGCQQQNRDAVCSDRLALWRVSRHFQEPGLPPCMHLHITTACQCAWGSAVQQQQCAPQRLTEVQSEDGV